MDKQKIKKSFASLGKRTLLTSLSAITFVVVGGLTIWAMAAFTEPTTGPAASVQDFAKNILGANNADNGFDSSAVVGNNDGSIIERQQYIWDNRTSFGSQGANRGPAVAMSAEAGAMKHANAAKYCYDLSAVAAVAMDGNTSTTYTDWRLPTVSEAAVFEGTVTSANYIWTASVRDANNGSWILLRLSDGYWSNNDCSNSMSVRCVR